VILGEPHHREHHGLVAPVRGFGLDRPALGDPVEDVAAFLGRRGRRLGGDLLPPDHGVVARDIALAFEGIELLGERLCRWSAPSGNRERTYSSM